MTNQTRKPAKRERRIQSPLLPFLRCGVAVYFAVIAAIVICKIHWLLGVVTGVVVLGCLLRLAVKPTYY